MPRDYYIREASDTDAVYYFWRSTVCAIARQMRYRLKTSAEARARVVEEDECHECGVCQEKQDKEYSTCCQDCGLLTCEDCLKISARWVCYLCGDEDGDGFVVCGHCGEGGGDHATEDCPANQI